jgi:hypothetical protein
MDKPGRKVEEGTGSEIEKNRIIVISCKQVQTIEVKTSKTERKNTAGKGDHLKPQEKKLTSTVLSRHLTDRTTKDHHRKSKENAKKDDVVGPPQQASWLA